MKIEIARIWANAARSKEFKQGKGYLDKDNTLCILGLLCQIAIIQGVCDVQEAKKSLYSYDKQLGRLPVSVQEWAGMSGQCGEIKGEFVNLTWYNDHGDYTFPELAEIIDNNWENM